LLADVDTIHDGIKSMASHDTRRVEFLNTRASTSALYWVDFKGLEVHYVDLPPGMTTVLSSFANHVWVARDMVGLGLLRRLFACSVPLFVRTIHCYALVSRLMCVQTNCHSTDCARCGFTSAGTRSCVMI